MDNFETIDLKQGTLKWLKFRKEHIGASDAPVIMNASPWKTPYRLWQEKLDLVEDGPTTSAMQRGIDLEQKARDKYIEITGIHVSPAVVKSKAHPFMIASLDGISADKKKAVEIKCPGSEDHGSAVKGIVPKKYIYQLVHQMLVLSIGSIDYFSYRSDDDYALVTVLLIDVQEEAEALIEKELKFWDCIQTLQEPELRPSDYTSMHGIEWNLMVGEYLTAKEKLKAWEEQEKKCRERLIELANDQNCVGGGIVLSKHTRNGNVDYSKIPELKSIDIGQYRKAPITYWKIAEEKVS